MARFDVYAAPDGGYWLDCQSDLLAGLNSRFVVPLRPRTEVSGGGDRRLNPAFEIDGAEQIMQTHLAAAIPAKLLRNPLTSLAVHDYTITAALDMLTGSY